MIYLLFAIICSVLIYVLFRIIDILKLDVIQIIAINYIVAVSIGIPLFNEPIGTNIIERSWFPIGIFIGFSFIVTFFLFARSTAIAGVAITAVASKMSVVIPVLAGFVVFAESAEIHKIIGVLLSLVSFILIFYKKKSKKVNYGMIALPLLIFLGTGINDTLTKYVHFYYLDGDENLFLLTVFFFAMASSIIVLIVKTIYKPVKLSVFTIIFGILVGLVNYGTMYFMIASLNFYEATFFFPVLSVSVVVLTALAGMVFFKEKLSFRVIAGISVALVSIILISSMA